MAISIGHATSRMAAGLKIDRKKENGLSEIYSLSKVEKTSNSNMKVQSLLLLSPLPPFHPYFFVICFLKFIK